MLDNLELFNIVMRVLKFVACECFGIYNPFVSHIINLSFVYTSLYVPASRPVSCPVASVYDRHV